MNTTANYDNIPQWVWDTIEETIDEYIYMQTGEKWNEETKTWEKEA